MLDYEYDACGRITKVTETRNGTATVTEYTYDALGQLLTEKVNGTVVNAMTYDSYGNILTKNGVSYSYDSAWKDRLTSVGDHSITYGSDPCNPATYFGNSLVWENGRQLKQFGNYTYKYNANGIRTRKTVNNINHFYFLDGTKILREKWGEDDIVPIYDTNESVIGLTHSTESGTNTYYFLKNLQGDIIAITDASGTVIARYKYDAWGKVLSVTDANGNCITSPFDIANVNPFRYRGYYYDTEIGLYYVSSRYYDPEIGRFISADEPMLLAFGGGKFGHNLFSYCENNPINQKDTNGYIAANIVGAAIGAIIGVVGGVFLGNWLADVLKLSGWERGIFVAAVAALVGAAVGAIGYFIGPYVAKIATKLGQYISNLIRQGRIALKELSSNVKSSLRTLLRETCCFVAGTYVSTPNGETAIEEIVVGDSVYAANPVTGEIGIKKVVRTFKKQTSILYHIVTSREEIITTAEHPFWVKSKGWIVANTLHEGDILCLQNGETVKITDVFAEKTEKPIVVYNFEVEDWHTYFVGTIHILVHNKCNWNYISDSFLKRKGLDAHSIKYEYLGKKANIKLYDLYYDKATGAISIFLKSTKQLVEVTTYFIK